MAVGCRSVPTHDQTCQQFLVCPEAGGVRAARTGAA